MHRVQSARDKEGGLGGLVRKFWPTTILLLVGFPLFSQVLTLEWDLLAIPHLELFVYHLAPDGSVLRISADEQRSATLGRQTLGLDWKEGRYQVYAVHPDFDTDFADWSAYRWLDYVKLTYERNTFKLELTPKPGSGSVWHALDLLGEGQEPVIVNSILPRRLMVFGQIMEADTGHPLAGVQVQVFRGSEKVIRDVSNRRGLYLVFLPEGSYQILWELGRYLAREAFFDLERYPFPQRVDRTLNLPLPENRYTIVLNWDRYPNDLNLTVQGSNTTAQGEYPTPEAGFKRLSLTVAQGETYTVTVQPVREEDRLLFAYSEARLTIHGKDSVLTKTLPLGHQSDWTAFRYQPGVGWVDP